MPRSGILNAKYLTPKMVFKVAAMDLRESGVDGQIANRANQQLLHPMKEQSTSSYFLSFYFLSIN